MSAVSRTATPARRRPTGQRLSDAVLAAGLGAAFILVPQVARTRLHPNPVFDLQLTAPDVALTAVSAVALSQVRRHPLAALVLTSVAGLVALAGGWQVNLALPAVSVAMLGYGLTHPRRQTLLAAGATSLTLGLAAVLVAGWWRGEWGRQDVALWIWLATAVALAVAGRRAAMAALEDRALRAEQSREETARRRVAEDRVRIARELHDVIAHHVAVIGVQAGVAEHLVERDPAGARASLHEVRGAARSVLAELQSVLGVLRQDESILPTDPSPGLAQLDQLVAAARSMGTPITVSRADGLPTLDPTADNAAYRLVQEALTNVHRHTSGAPTTVTLRPDDGHLEVTVVNSPPAGDEPLVPGPLGAADLGSGLGLRGMRERVQAAGGSLEVGPTPAGGFRVAARLPLAQELR